MRITPKQKELFKLGLPIEVLIDSFLSESSIGYCTKVKGKGYEIHLSSRLLPDMRVIVLIHELSHIKLGHTEYSIEDMQEILKDRVDVPLPNPRVLKKLSNIAMDLEVNSKYLTTVNKDNMKNGGVPPVLREDMKPPMDYEDSWIDYLVKLIASGVPNSPYYGNIEDVEIIHPSTSTKKVGSIKDVIKGDEVTVEEKIGKNPGSSPSHQTTDLPSSKEEKITNFLMSILSIKRVPEIDSMKLYNRGTRGRQGNILYTSHSKKVRKSFDRLLIVIDVSGSMDIKDISKAIHSCKDIAIEANIDTRIVHWNTELCQEYSILEFPEKFETGGGTDVFRSLDYARKEGFDKVVIYSDMRTADTFEEKKGDLWVACICVDTKAEEEVPDFVTENSDMLLCI